MFPQKCAENKRGHAINKHGRLIFYFDCDVVHQGWTVRVAVMGGRAIASPHRAPLSIETSLRIQALGGAARRVYINTFTSQQGNSITLRERGNVI